MQPLSAETRPSAKLTRWSGRSITFAPAGSRKTGITRSAALEEKAHSGVSVAESVTFATWKGAEPEAIVSSSKA